MFTWLGRFGVDHRRLVLGITVLFVVAAGLERTGRLITAAALVLAITFAAFGTAGMSFMKLMGIGLTLAIVIDATVIRGLLVPAFMRLAGEANSWAPVRLRRRVAPSAGEAMERSH